MINAVLRQTYCTTKEEKQTSKNNEESIVSSPMKMINSDGLSDDREQNGGSSLLKHNKIKMHLNFYYCAGSSSSSKQVASPNNKSSRCSKSRLAFPAVLNTVNDTTEDSKSFAVIGHNTVMKDLLEGICRYANVNGKVQFLVTIKLINR